MRADIKTYIGLFLLIVGGYFLLEWSSPRSTDWSYSYSREHARPFGCEILYRKLPVLVPDKELRYGKHTLFRAKRQGQLEDASVVIIGEKVGLNGTDRELLMEKVRNGGKVFIAARSIDRPLLDSLAISMDHVFPWENAGRDPEEAPEEDTVRLSLEKADTPKNGYPFSKGLGSAHFERANPHSTDILGRSEDGKRVFLRAEWGDGAFYLHSKPLSFTNYYLAQEASYPYAFKVLSHLPVEDLYWDEHYKPGRKGSRVDPTQTPFRFLLQHPSLRAALWVLGIGVLFLLTFGAKRDQRAMPIIRPPRNGTLSYASVLARLHFEEGGHHRVARMRARQFLHRVREATGMKLEEDLTERELQSRIAQRTGVEEGTVRACLLLVDRASKGVTKFGQRDLLALEKRIRTFWKEMQKEA